MEDKKGLKKGEKAALVSILVSFVLAVLKAVVGFYSGAVVLISDALDSASDVITSFAAYLGLKIAGKKATEKFPYGFYKAENLASFIISGFIIYAAILLLIKGYHRIFIIPSLSYPFITLAAAVFSGIVALLMSLYLKKKGEEINAESLIASSKDRLKDTFAAAVVFIAILCTYFRIPYAEGIITIIISLLILRIGLITVKDSVFALMDVSPSKEIEQKVRKILNSISGVEHFTELRLRKAGPFIFGQVKIKIRKSIDVARAHEISDRIENKIKKSIKQIESFTIHIEPYKSARQKIVIPISGMGKNGLNSRIMLQFGRANYFMFVETQNKKVIDYYIKKNPYKERKIKAGLATVHFVIKEKIDALVTKEMGEISFHALRDNLVDVYKTEGKTARQVVNKFVNNKLKKLSKPTKEV